MAHISPNYRTSTPPAGIDGTIVDLSAYAEPLSRYEDISHLLTEEQEMRIVDFVHSMLDMAYWKVRRRYDHWLQADRAHDVYVPPEATEFREKAVIADTRAIADTVLTYLMAALAGRNPMFMLEGLDRKSRRAAAILERQLHQQLRRTGGEWRIAQMLNDMIRYGYAPTKIVWNAQTNSNQIVNFDPRRAFVDPRVNWGDWSAAQFVVFTSHTSFDALYQTGLYPKLKMYPGLRVTQAAPRHGWNAHQWHKEEGRGLSIDPTEVSSTTASGRASFQLGHTRVVDEVWMRLAGYQLGLPGVDTLWLVCAILDESVVIRFQLNPYGRQFPVVIGALFNDAHKTYGQSLYDIMLPLHDIATWLLRSRIDNVQAALNNLIFADPTMVSISDLIDRNPWGIVRTMPGVKPGEGFYIAQIPDVTRGHWQDIAALSELKQRLSAASDAQQGVPTADGIRTATEIQRLTQLGSQRLGVLARIISATTLRPMVNMMVANIQDALNFSGSIRINDEEVPALLADMVKDNYLEFNISDLQGNVDYLVVDGTLPIEPTRSPETWLNLLQIVNQTGLAMELDAKAMALEAIRSMGVSDIDRFRISPEKLREGPTPSQQLMLLEKMRGASVIPEEQLHNEVQKGNLIPLRQAA